MAPSLQRMQGGAPIKRVINYKDFCKLRIAEVFFYGREEEKEGTADH